MIRLAKESDRASVLRMAQSFHEVSPVSEVPFEVSVVNDLFDAYLKGDGTKLMVILAEDAEGVYGCIVGVAAQLYFSPRKVASEVIWWVDPDHRKGRESLRLFKAFEKWAERIDAAYVQMSMLPEVTNLDTFYKKNGFSLTEQVYMKRSM